MEPANNINRIGLVVTPKDPFYLWALSVVDKLPDRSADDLNMIQGPTVYLLPETRLDGQADTDALVARYSGRIFAFELGGWTEKTELWPKKQSFAVFRNWFDAQVSMIWDLDRGEIVTYGDA